MAGIIRKAIKKRYCANCGKIVVLSMKYYPMKLDQRVIDYFLCPHCSEKNYIKLSGDEDIEEVFSEQD